MKKYKHTFNDVSRGFIIYVCLIRGTIAQARTSEEFLNSVINQLKSSKISSNEYRAFYNTYSENYELDKRSHHSDNNDNYQEIPNSNNDNNNFDNNGQVYLEDTVGVDDESKTDLNEFSNNNDSQDGQNWQNDSSSNIVDQYSNNQETNLQYSTANQNSLNTYQNNQNEYHFNNEDSNVLLHQSGLNTGYHYPFPANSFQSMDNLIDNVMTVNDLAKPHQNKLPVDSIDAHKKPVEPLFVAMAGFVSVAMIFMSAVIFLPKLLTPVADVANLKKSPQEIATLTKLAMEAMEGNDCTERIACEVGRAMKSFQVGSKPIRIMEIILPTNMSKQLAQIRKALISEQKCKLITCKRIIRNEKKPVKS